MRLSAVICGGLAGLAGALPASAATIIIYTDPMTLESRMVVVDPRGPDRAFLCTVPPAVAGCHAVPLKRSGS